MSSEPLPQIGPYRLTHVMGKGGMGVVYAGEHLRTGMSAAVKTVTSVELSKLSQIRREIRSLARLSHPGVVVIRDHGMNDGVPWYAMEQLRGSTLADLFDRLWIDHRNGTDSEGSKTSAEMATDVDATVEIGGVPDGSAGAAGEAADGGYAFGAGRKAAAGHLPEVLSLAYRICEILSYVHGEGIVHRDLKPANIFIRSDGLPVLVDFGLVSETRDAVGREVADPAQRVSGSPPYMAPEQITGDVLDARCDLYALGCMLYQLVTGVLPFTGTRSQIFNGHLERTPVRPSDLVSGVPPALDDLILSLMAKSQGDRVGYAENVALALAALGADPAPWPYPPPPVRSYLYRAAFVGRSDSMGLISSQLAAAKSGSGQIVLLTGESGSGKTRQASEAASRAARTGMAVVSGSCQPGGLDGEKAHLNAQPLYPLLPWLEMVADLCLEGGPARQQALLGPHAAVLASYSLHIGALPGMAGLSEPSALPGDEARKRLFRALRDVAAACARLRPLLMIIDDLQWADELSLGFLDHMSGEGVEGLPLVILGTLRSEERIPALDRLLASPAVDVVELNRMGTADVEAMVGGMLAIRCLPSAFTTFLAERSSGNPFFIVEYLRSAVSGGVLLRDRSGRWTLADAGPLDGARYEALPLPQSLRALIEQRLGRLGGVARRAADCAALIGRHFDMELIRRVEEFDEAAIAQVIDELVDRQVLEPEESEGFRFVHDKIREVAGSLQDAAVQRGLHLRIAGQLEAMHPDPGSRTAIHGRLGRHWAGAGIPDKAARCLRQAAEQARRLHAVDEAIELFRAASTEIAAVRRSRPDHPDFWRAEALAVNEALSELLSLKGRHEAARAMLHAGLEDSGGDMATASRLNRKIAKAWEGEHRHDLALAAYAEAEAALADGNAAVDGWMDERIEIRLGRIWVYYWSARSQEIEKELETSRVLIENHGRPHHRYGFYFSQILGALRRDRYRVDFRTVELGERLLKAARESQRPAEIAFAHFEMGFILLFAGRLPQAEDLLSQALTLSRSLGDVSGETRALCYFAILLRRMHRMDETDVAARELLVKAARNRMGDYVGIAHALLGWVASKRGDSATAAAEVRMARDAWAGLPFVYSMQWTAALVELKLALDAGDSGRLAEIAGLLRHPIQLWLPDPVDDALARAVDGHRDGDGAALLAGVRTALEQAEALGWL